MRVTEGLNQERRMGIEEGGKKAQKDKATPPESKPKSVSNTPAVPNTFVWNCW